nr:17 kDa surface antigen precursor [uncultured bacterium]
MTMKKFSSLAVAAVFAATSVLAGCQGMQDAPKQTGGAVLGGVAGGALGSQIGGGMGKTAAIVGGTLLGALLGSEVGKSLDRADQASLSRTTHSALESAPTGSPMSWNNPDSGHAGTVVPTSTYYRGNTPCRDFTSTVTIDGRNEPMKGSACRDPDGTWRLSQ